MCPVFFQNFYPLSISFLDRAGNGMMTEVNELSIDKLKLIELDEMEVSDEASSVGKGVVEKYHR